MTRTAMFALCLLVLATAAHAKLTPRDGLGASAPIQMSAVSARPIAAERERDYYSAAPVVTGLPQTAGRCTARIILFEKIRLAQACF